MKFFLTLTHHPIKAIQIVFAVGLVIYGLYLGSPLYTPGASTALGQFFETLWVREFVFLMYVLSGLLTIIAVCKKSVKWSGRGCVAMFYAFLFSSLFRIFTIGWVPLIWLYPLMLAITSGILYLNLRLSYASGN